MTWARMRHLPKILLFLFPCAAGSRLAQAAIRYEVSIAHPERHLFHITMEIPDVASEVTVQMPAWNALYQIRDFSAHVREVDALAGSAKAPIEKVDKQTWRIRGAGTITIRYDTYWDEGGPFTTQLNGEHAFINPAMILMYVPDRRTEAVGVVLEDVPGPWRATGTSDRMLMESTGGARSFEFEADSYDAMADTAIEVGQFQEIVVPGLDAHIFVAVHGDNWRQQRMEDELRRICSYELKLMGGAPFEQYMFIVHLGKAAGSAGGGMEHSNGAAISLRSSEDFRNVAAHEFFHLWNVKRIRPTSLEPVDYAREQYSHALWFAEGVTSAYASYTLVRTGLWSKDQFYEDLSEQISELENRPANRWQSAEQSSLDAWFEKYPLYNRPDHSVSYYTKGQVLGVLLDVLIRDRTRDEKSLDDVLRLMNVEFAKKGKGYRDTLDIRLTAEQVAGGSFEEFFEKYVAHAEPLPYQQVLPLAGLELRTVERQRPILGFSAERDSTETLVVSTIDPQSPAERAGLKPGDVVLNWNGAEPPKSVERWVSLQKKGSSLRLTVRRDDNKLTLDFRLAEIAETLYRVVEDPQAGEKARLIREGLLRGLPEPALRQSPE